MSRWSRRWSAGESSKDQLRTILEEAAITKAPRGSIEQLTGDFYAGCVNEAEVDRLGVKPLQPLMTQIDQMKDRTDVEGLIGRLQGAVPDRARNRCGNGFLP